MSFEPHYVNSWIIYCCILYFIGIFGLLIKDLIYPYNNIETFQEWNLSAEINKYNKERELKKKDK